MHALNAYSSVGGGRLTLLGNAGTAAESNSLGADQIAGGSSGVSLSDWTPAKALLFEIENVLYDGTLWQRWLWRLLNRLAPQRDYDSFCDTWQCGYLPEVYRGGREWTDAFRAFLNDWGLSPGQIDEVEAASTAQRRDLNEHIRPLPGAAKALADLAAAGIVLGVLANSELPSDAVRARLDRLELVHTFRFVLSSHDLGCAKPEAGCYQAALDCLGLPLADVAFVGHAPADLAGATDFGLRTIATNRDAHSTADVCIPRLGALPVLCHRSS